MKLNGRPTLIDAIYEATLEPQAWTGVLERLADHLGGTSAWLSRMDLTNGVASGLLARLDPEWSRAYQAHYHQVNPFSILEEPEAFLRAWRPTVITDEHRMERTHLVGGEYFNDFMRPQGVDGVMIIRLALDGHTTAAININRSQAKAGFTPLELSRAAHLQPHLIRAYSITRQLATAQAERAELAEAIEDAPHAMFVLGVDGAVRRANRTAETLLRRRPELRVDSGRLTAVDPAVAAELEAHVAAAGSAEPRVRRGASLSIPRAEGPPPLAATVSPLRAERAEVFGLEPSVLVCVGDPAHQGAVSEAQLIRHFGLTPAEARVAFAVQGGGRPREIAEAMKLSPNTVRVHLAHVFDKTGVSRQADLVRLIGRMPPG